SRHLGRSVGAQVSGAVREGDPDFDRAIKWIAGTADERYLAVHLFGGRIGGQDGGRISHLELRGDCIREWGLDDDLTHVSDVKELASRGRKLTLILKLICDDAGDRRANSRIA